MRLRDLYSEYFANWLSNGSLIQRDKISMLGIRHLYDRYLTKEYVTKAWNVLLFPVEYNRNFIQMVRTEMYEAFPEVRTVVHMNCEPVKISVNSQDFERRLNNAANRYYKISDFYENLSDAERETGFKKKIGTTTLSVSHRDVQRIADVYNTYMYVHNKTNDGLAFSQTYLFIQAHCKDTKILEKYEDKLFQLCARENVMIRTIKGTVGQYLDNFCPASFKQEDVKKFQPLLMSSENIAVCLPYKTKGLVGNGSIMLGEDIQTHLPFMIDFTGSGTAQVVLVCGKAGCGKTFLAEAAAIELTAFGIHCSVTDIKGGEWCKVQKYVPTLEIDMSGDSGRFVNLMRLDDLHCTRDDCIYAYESAIGNTVGLFEVATNLLPAEGNPSDLRSILNQAVEKVYTMHGVDKKNPDTFKITATFTYEMVLSSITNLQDSHAYTAEQKQLCKLVKSRCATYFMGEGRYAEAFKNELTVNDILETPMVIYNFNKNRGETLDIIDNIRVFMARCMDSRKHFIRKQRGLHQAVFYEELQRCGSMDTFVRNISADVTGSRSNNLTVFLLLNAVSTFDSEKFGAIKSNITTKIIGKSSSHDIEKLVTDYDCGDIKTYMQLILENKSGKYSHCFAVSYDTGNDKNHVMLHTVVPKEMEEQFHTRDILKL